MDTAKLTIRDVRRDDLTAVISLLNREILSSVSTFRIHPIDAAGTERWWQDRQDGRYPALVGQLEDHGPLVGWASLSRWSVYEAYDRCAEVSVWIEPAYQGRGYGRLLYEALLARASQLGLGVLLARIEAQNEASLRLHRACGFETIGTMRGVGEKFGRLLDVVMMQRQL